MTITNATAQTIESNVKDSQRLLDRDSENLQKRLNGMLTGPAYGYRLRCRVCMAETQVNLPHQAKGFFTEHEVCQEIAKPVL